MYVIYAVSKYHYSNNDISSFVNNFGYRQQCSDELLVMLARPIAGGDLIDLSDESAPGCSYLWPFSLHSVSLEPQQLAKWETRRWAWTRQARTAPRNIDLES